MSLLDKVISAVTPPESQESRDEAHRTARSSAMPGDWLSQILDHHEQVAQAFAAVRAAADAHERRVAQKALGVVLNGHSMAEEAVIYPAIARSGEKASAEMAYTEQVAAKQQMAALDHLDPMSPDYLDKLGHLEGAVQHHVYEEEHDWFPKLKAEAAPADQAILSQRYKEEFERYMGADLQDAGETSGLAAGAASGMSSGGTGSPSSAGRETV